MKRRRLSAPGLALAIVTAIVLLLGAAVALLAWPRAEYLPASSPQAWAPTPANIARGAYLARAGNCAACHTARAGQPYAGGRAIETPFGRVLAPNLTPDRATGIGAWSADEFWNAMHNGIARDGRLLYPAFPYPNYTRVSRADTDALFAFLRSLAPVRRANQAHALRFPYNSQAALAAWRLLYFRPGLFEPQPARGAAWNRGAYLAEGLGHCAACHAARNRLGASSAGLGGGMIPVLEWYAPPLASDDPELAQLLHGGVAPGGVVAGPMADVVRHSLQYLTPQDIGALAGYLRALPKAAPPARPRAQPPQALLRRGGQLYDRHCADCHGKDGRGALDQDGRPAYPALAGNRSLLAASPANPIRVVLHGGFAPQTAANPRPYGMPPFGPLLDDAEVAAVLSYARASWGNQAGMVTAPEVDRRRGLPLE